MGQDSFLFYFAQMDKGKKEKLPKRKTKICLKFANSDAQQFLNEFLSVPY